MGLVAEIVLLILLGLMVYEDFKYRGISWYLFPLALVAIITKSYTYITIDTTVLNIGFVLMQLLLVTLYFTLKQRKLVNITTNHFGIGDVLFLGIIAISFSTVNFVFFYLLGIVISLLIGLLLIQSKSTDKTIPFAGIMAAFYITCMGIDRCTPWNMGDDYWIIQKLGW